MPSFEVRANLQIAIWRAFRSIFAPGGAPVLVFGEFKCEVQFV